MTAVFTSVGLVRVYVVTVGPGCLRLLRISRHVRTEIGISAELSPVGNVLGYRGGALWDSVERLALNKSSLGAIDLAACEWHIPGEDTFQLL
jgi:hypothetical protein